MSKNQFLNFFVVPNWGILIHADFRTVGYDTVLDKFIYIVSKLWQYGLRSFQVGVQN